MAEGGQGKVISFFLFLEMSLLSMQVGCRLDKLGIGGVASKSQPPRQFDLLMGAAGLLGQAIGQSFTLAMREMIVQ